MANKFFDFLTGAGVPAVHPAGGVGQIVPGVGAPEVPPTQPPPTQPPGGFAAMLADPNIQQLMAQMGARIGAGGVGEAIGVPTSQMIRSRQMAKATEKQQAGQEEFWERMRGVLGGGDLSKIPITTPSDLTGANSVFIDDKGMTLKMPRPGAKAPFGTQQPLEAEGIPTPTPTPVAPVAPTAPTAPMERVPAAQVGGRDMRPFWKAQLA